MASRYRDLSELHDPSTGKTAPARWGRQIRVNQDRFAYPPLADTDIVSSTSGFNIVARNTSTQTAQAHKAVFDRVKDDTDLMTILTDANRGDYVMIRQSGWYLLSPYVRFIESTASSRAGSGGAHSGSRWLHLYKNSTAETAVGAGAGAGQRLVTKRCRAARDFDTMFGTKWLGNLSSGEFVSLGGAWGGGSSTEVLQFTGKIQVIKLSE